MTESKTPEIEISSFAAPTREDIDRLNRLPEAEREAVVAREIQKGIDSGVSEMTMEDIWAEAVRRVAAKTPGPDVP